MPEFGRCWNEKCFMYGQHQPITKVTPHREPPVPICSDCQRPLGKADSKPLEPSTER